MAKLFFSSMIALQLLLSSVAAILLDPYLFSKQFLLPSSAFGPNSVAFTNNNPDIGYVSISDGRVLRFYVENGTFEDFAYTSPFRRDLCNGNKDATSARICGMVLGLSVDNVNQILYAVDANLGLFSMNIAQGGLATFITNTAGGQQFKLLSGMDVDPVNGDVYFTDASSTLDYGSLVSQGDGNYDSTGRLIKYDRTTKEVTVILTGLAFPAGPVVSIDGTFVLIPQRGTKNILKYYIKGLKQNQSEIITVPGSPRKIKRASTPGEYWVAIDKQLQDDPSIFIPIAYKFNSFGWELIKKDLSPQFPGITISVIQETNPFTFFVASRFTNSLTQYSVFNLP